jgi:hypothetical protein
MQRAIDEGERRSLVAQHAAGEGPWVAGRRPRYSTREPDAGFVYARHTRATHSMTICSELCTGISRLKGLMLRSTAATQIERA